MTQEMTPAEFENLKRALLSAFPSSGALEQVLLFQLGEQLNVIAGGNNYGEIVFNLIHWAEANDKTAALISGARKENPGNIKLRTFEEHYKLRRASRKSGTETPELYLPPQIRSALIDILLRIPVVSSYDSRTILLNGIPGVFSLMRNNGIAKVDLEGIIDQLESLGRLSSGNWPLLIFVDNVLSHVDGFAIGDELQAVRGIVAEKYKGKKL